jgi:DNA-binding SARP family transcriptional activator
MEAGKPLALLAYVALSPKARANRDRIAELFWPGTSIADARHSLRQALYRLRQATSEVELVHAHEHEVELFPLVSFDFAEAERAVSSGDFTRAHELLSGNFLEGFAIPESKEFEGWVESQRARFRECRVRAGTALAERHLAAGDTTRGLDLAEEVAAIQPLDDGPIRLVMVALAAAGRHVIAMARFHAYADLLRRELDDQPGLELAGYAQELETYIRTQPEASVGALPSVSQEVVWPAPDANGGARGAGGAARPADHLEQACGAAPPSRSEGRLATAAVAEQAPKAEQGEQGRRWLRERRGWRVGIIGAASAAVLLGALVMTAIAHPNRNSVLWQPESAGPTSTPSEGSREPPSSSIPAIPRGLGTSPTFADQPGGMATPPSHAS